MGWTLSDAPPEVAPVKQEETLQPAENPMKYAMGKLTTDYGWSPEAAAGMVGNAWHESGGNPAIWGDAGKSFGLFQHSGPRRKALAEYATSRGKPVDSIDLQIEFLNHELMTDYSGVADKLRGVKTPQEAAQIFSNQYEQPGKPMMGSRIAAAKRAYSMADLERVAEATAAKTPSSEDSGKGWTLSDAPPKKATGWTLSDKPPTSKKPPEEITPEMVMRGAPEAGYIEPIGTAFGKVMEAPFIPLRKGLEKVYEYLIEPGKEPSLKQWSEALETAPEMVAGAPEAFAPIGSKEAFVSPLEFALAPSYLRFIGKAGQILKAAGVENFYKYAPQWAFKPFAKGGMPVPLSSSEVADKLYAMSGAERAEMARKYPQFRDVLDEMTTLTSKEREPYSPEMAARARETRTGLPYPEGMGETFEMREPPPETRLRKKPEPVEPDVWVKQPTFYEMTPETAARKGVPFPPEYRVAPTGEVLPKGVEPEVPVPVTPEPPVAPKPAEGVTKEPGGLYEPTRTEVPTRKELYPEEGATLEPRGPISPDVTEKLTVRFRGAETYEPEYATKIQGIIDQQPESIRYMIHDHEPFPGRKGIAIREIKQTELDTMPADMKATLKNAKAVTWNKGRINTLEGTTVDEEAIRHEVVHMSYDYIPKELRETAIADALADGDKIIDFINKRKHGVLPEGLDWELKYAKKFLNSIIKSKDKVFGMELDLMIPNYNVQKIAEHLGVPSDGQYLMTVIHNAMARKKGYRIPMPEAQEEMIAYRAGKDKDFADNLFKSLMPEKPVQIEPKPPAPPVAPEGKEPWEMTNNQFAELRSWIEGYPSRVMELGYGDWSKDKLNKEIAKLGKSQVQSADLINEFWSDLKTTDSAHKALVRQALASGKPVPPEVLADYPDLKPTPTEPTVRTVGEVYQDSDGWYRIEGTTHKFNEPQAAQKAVDNIKKYGLGEEGFIDVSLLTPGIETITSMKKGFQSLVLPTAQSPEHLKQGEILGSKIGTMHRMGEGAVKELKRASKMFDKLGVHDPNIPFDQNIGAKFRSDASVGRQMRPEFQTIADKVQRGFDKRAQILEDAGAPIETLRDNYFPGMWTKESHRAFNQAMDEYVGAGNIIPQDDITLLGTREKQAIRTRVDELLKQGAGSDKDYLKYLSRRPFKGHETFRKEKVFDDTMLAEEFGLRPVSNNPIDIVKLKYAEMDRSIMANRALREWEKNGDVVNVDNSGRPLKGRTRAGTYPEPLDKAEWSKIDGRYGDIWMRDSHTHMLTKVGERWAKRSVTDVMNNYLSTSLYNSRYFGIPYRGVMSMGNMLNQYQLGVFSGFHAGFTSIETQITSGGEVLKDIYGLARGNRSPAQLGRTLARYPAAMVRTAWDGSKVLREWNSPQMDVPTNIPIGQLPTSQNHKIAQVAKAAELAGAGFKMEHGLRTYQSDKMVRDWYGGKKVKAVLRSPVAFTELGMKPIMEFLVPRQKAGVFAELAGRIIEQNPTKTLEELRPLFRQAWNRTDARLGQVQYDRLFMNNIAKNVVQLLMRAPGWTGGTIAEVGGSAKDAAKFIGEWFRTGKAPEDIPDRVAYTISLVGTMAATNALLTYAFTGETPMKSKSPIVDMFAFRDGGMDDKGNPTRMLLPSYMKDIYAWGKNWSHTLLAKTHPIISLASEVWRNRDYYNNMIYDEEKGIFNRDSLKRIGGHILQAYVPFWIRGAGQIAEREGGLKETLTSHPGKLIAPEFGIMPATRAYTQTPLDEVMNRYRKVLITRTPEEAEQRKVRVESLSLLRQGKTGKAMEKVRQAIKDKKVDVDTAVGWLEEGTLPAKQTQFQKLPLEWQAKALLKANPEENKLLMPLLVDKIDRAKDKDLEKAMPLIKELIEKRKKKTETKQ